MKCNKGELFDLLEKERRAREDDEASRRRNFKAANTQTKHSGPIPVLPKRPVKTSASTQCENVAVENAWTQTEEPKKPPSPPKPAKPQESETEVDQAILMEELNDIRKILESDTGNKLSASNAWSEVCSHGVLSAMSSVKQRAKFFRNEVRHARPASRFGLCKN